MQRFESRSPRLESWRISIPECGGSNPAAPTGQSVSNAYGIGSRLKCHEMAASYRRPGSPFGHLAAPRKETPNYPPQRQTLESRVRRQFPETETRPPQPGIDAPSRRRSGASFPIAYERVNRG
jgi:hypothetical protein